MKATLFNRTTKKWLITACLFVLSNTTEMYAQALSSYTFSASSGTYTALSSPTFPTMSSADDGSVNSISIGFDFWYMGTKYTTIGISTNGYVSFGTAGTELTNALASGGGRPLLAPLWDDIDAVTTGSNISYKLAGTAPNRTFTVEFNDMQWDYAASAAVIDFQVILTETTGVIQFVYNQNAAAVNSGGASIGITASGTGSNNYISLNGSGASPTASLSSETTSISSKPANGQIYTFTPPTNVAPTSLTFSSVTTTGMTLNWTASSPTTNVLKYAIYKSTDNSTFTYVSTVNIGTNTYAATSLTAGTTYYWKVYAISEGYVSSALTGNQSTSSSVSIGAGTVASTTFPFYNYYENNKTQILYLQSELGTARTFTNLSLDAKFVTADATKRDMQNFTINLKHTASTSFGVAYESMTGSTTVYSSAPYNLPSSTGVFTIDITDFAYNGTNNLIVEIIWGDNAEYTGSSDYYTVNCTTNASYMVVYGYDDATAPPNYTGRSYSRPNISFGYDANSAPTVTTTAISSITPTTAASGGTITSIGSASVTVSGICWNTSTDPTTANSKTTDGATSATSFASNLSSLSAQTYYYVRAYATNSVGTSYGSNVAFYTYSTEPTGHSATFTASVASASQIDLTFTAASTYGADGYIILRLAGATPPNNTNINDGTAPGSLSMPGSTVLVTTITNDAATSYSNTGLSASTQYSYAIIPYNWDASNAATYNYRTSVTIPTCNGTTSEGPSNEGFVIAGNIVMNGTLNQTDDENYFSMSGTSKSITGTGTYTNTKLNVNGTITFDGTISSGSFSKTFVTSAKTFTLNTSKTYVNGLFNNQGTTTLSSGSIFQNSGNWLNYGTITANSTSTATFNGGSAQTIGGNAITTFYNATIANTSGGVALGINSTVQNTLTLTSGKFTVQGYTLTIGTTSANGSVSGGSSSSYIIAYDYIGTIGYVKEFVNSNATYSYPIGDATDYTPLTFTLTSNGGLSSAYLTIYTKDVKVPGLNSSITTYLDRYWDVTESGFTSPTYTMSYTYVDADLVGSETGMLPIKKSGSTWYKPTGSSFTNATAQGTGSFNAGTNTLTWSGLTTFSGFGGIPDIVIALPIELISLKGVKDGRNNLLTWVTASEVNNDFFTIEKTTDGENFEIVGAKDGAGNSNQYLEYSLVDYDVKEVINYYRLKQTDFDGKYSFSNVISIDNRVNTANKEIVMITNILGQEVNEFYRGIVIILYADGTSKKVIQ